MTVIEFYCVTLYVVRNLRKKYIFEEFGAWVFLGYHYACTQKSIDNLECFWCVNFILAAGVQKKNLFSQTDAHERWRRVFPFWFPCAKLCMVVSGVCVRESDSGGSNHCSWCLVWVDRQTASCFPSDCDYSHRGERGGERGRAAWREIAERESHNRAERDAELVLKIL